MEDFCSKDFEQSQPMAIFSNREGNDQQTGYGPGAAGGMYASASPEAPSGVMMQWVPFGSLYEILQSCLGLPTDSLWDLQWGVHGGLLLRPPTCTMTRQMKYLRSTGKKNKQQCVLN